MAGVGGFMWPRAFRATVRNEFRPSIYREVERVLAPFEGQQVSEAALAELQDQVERVVRETLFELHRPDEDLTILVKNDDVLGPVCVVRRADGREVSLAEFEAGLGT
jgi:hypothetical protein